MKSGNQNHLHAAARKRKKALRSPVVPLNWYMTLDGVRVCTTVLEDGTITIRTRSSRWMTFSTTTAHDALNDARNILRHEIIVTDEGDFPIGPEYKDPDWRDRPKDW